MHQASASTSAVPETKKTYHSPELREHGTVGELTQTTAGIQGLPDNTQQVPTYLTSNN